MLKLKELLKETFERKFGEPLPTFDSVMKDHQLGKLYTDKDRPSFQVKEEKLNEAPEHEMAKHLNKVTNDIFKIIKIYEPQADVEGMVRSWMIGLHAKLKKSGVKV